MAQDQNFTNQDFKVIGSRPERPDGVDKVTGRARYGADASAPGQLVGLVLRSPHAHAEIKKIDTSKAEKIPGVKAIITSADLPDLTTNPGNAHILENCMARGRALYDGHAVAAVAAVDNTTAKAALSSAMSSAASSCPLEWIMASGSPASTGSPTFFSCESPTAGSMLSVVLTRPAPSNREARPTASASTCLTYPEAGAGSG